MPKEKRRQPDLFDCAQDVCVYGYKWIETRPTHREHPEIEPAEEPYLVSNWPPGERTYPANRYDPFRRDRSLFRVFARTEATRDGILRFANEYGRLGGDLETSVLDYEPMNSGYRPYVWGESLSTWLREIHRMAVAVALWDAVQQHGGHIGRFIRWERGGVIFKDEYRLKVITSPQIHPDLFAQLRPGEVERPALLFVQREVNEHLESRVAPCLLWPSRLESTDDRNVVRSQTVLSLDDNSNGLRLHFRSDGLIGTLWLQFAQAIAGKKEYRLCQVCQAPFEIAPDTARTDKLYCSQACRFKAYRRRQAEARRLFAAGVNPPEVARRLDADLPTVLRWINSPRLATIRGD